MALSVNKLKLISKKKLVKSQNDRVNGIQEGSSLKMMLAKIRLNALNRR